jgi:hypothetical protein
MADIATVEELASFLQTDLDTATANLLLLDLAQGLVTAEIGIQNPWPSVARSVALAAAGRAYVNPEGLKQDTTGGTTAIYNTPLYMNGVYLSELEKASLHQWSNGPGGSTLNQPQGSFPESECWPDPTRRWGRVDNW